MSALVEGKSIGETYVAGLKQAVEGKLPFWYLTFHCSQPILRHRRCVGVSLDIRDHLRAINVGEDIFQKFCKFRFSNTDESTGDNSGLGWINGRIISLLDDQEGRYKEHLSRRFGFDQLDAVIERLKARDRNGRRITGGSINALVCTVYDPNDDLRRACKPRPRTTSICCVTQIDFKPIGDRLNLMATFRSQYLDLKAYGNLISLAILLDRMCHRTGYAPGAVVSTTHKVVFGDPPHYRGRELYEHMMR